MAAAVTYSELMPSTASAALSSKSSGRYGITACKALARLSTCRHLFATDRARSRSSRGSREAIRSSPSTWRCSSAICSITLRAHDGVLMLRMTSSSIRAGGSVVDNEAMLVSARAYRNCKPSRCAELRAQLTSRR